MEENKTNKTKNFKNENLCLQGKCDMNEQRYSTNDCGKFNREN